jgi:predicted permease
MPDLRDAFRSLRATPLVTGVAVLSLALGIGANTAIFSILDSLILRSLPVREPHKLALVLNGGERTFSSWTNPIWEQVRDRQSMFDGAFAWSSARFNLSERGQSDFANGMMVSGRYFDLLGVPAILGRTLTPADDRRGGGPAGPAAVVSYNFWQRRFGGRADAIGKPLTLDRIAFTVVGVTAPEFFGTDVGRSFDVAIALGAEPLVRGKDSGLDHRSMWWLNMMIRLKPGQSLESATQALRGLQPQIREATMPSHYRPQDRDRYLKDGFALREAATGASGMRTRYQRPLTTLMVVVGLVLLIACANIANLLLARATARRQELAVRLALGASRWRIARQLLVESLVLSTIGAALGLVFAQWGSRLLVRQLSTQVNTVFLDLSLDWRVLGFTASLAIATAVLFGVAPAFRATRAHPGDSLKEQGRSVTGEGRWSIGNILVVAQVALSLILVVAAGLFVRTFVSLAGQHLGFDRDKVLVVSVNARNTGVEAADRPAFYERIRQAVAAVPGVGAAGASAVTPVSGSTWQFTIELPDRPPVPEEARSVFVNIVSPGWFATYGTALKAGRDFTSHDRAGAVPAAIVNETLAKKFLTGSPPVGQTVHLGGREKKQLEVIGVAADAVYRSLRDPVPPTLYLPLSQSDDVPSGFNFSVRSAGGSPALLSRGVAAAMSGVDPNLTLTFRALAEQVDSALIQERVIAILAGFFGALALLLAGLGLYGVTAYAVSRRRGEIGIRMALGAAPRGVVVLVLRRVAVLVFAGVIVGAAASWWAATFVETLVFGLEPRDLTTLAAGVGMLLLVGAIAGGLPATRAATIDPARVLRDS